MTWRPKIKENLPNFRRGMVITDGVFSMDGDVAPLDKIYEVAERYGLITMVDDAHGEGVLGHGGRGIVDHFGLHGKFDIEIGTFSKAFGVVGGIISGKKVVIDYLRQRAAPSCSPTPSPPPTPPRAWRQWRSSPNPPNWWTVSGRTPATSRGR
jgi:7-keto-8-aminopelargonate synthetase-like enzyme